MATQQELIVKIRGDIEDIQQKLSTVQKSVGKTQSAFSKIGGGIAKVGKGIAIAGAAVSGAATLIGKKSLDAAAYVEEMENKFNVVFSNTSSAMDEWATDFANAIGRNNTEIKTAISNQADLMIGMGMSEEAAGDLAKQYTTLAYDLASFNNVSDEQAIEAMTKALMGETEIDPARILQEASITADKLDINEEITRFKSHNLLFANAIKEGSSQGKKLNFILQEMGREANTLGTKCQDAEIQSLAILLKDEIESMREQVMNIE